MALLFSHENEVFRAYGFYAALMALKMFAVVFLTTYKRLQKKVFANPEDAVTRPGGKVTFNDEDVERIRRVHLNDMENIIPFWVLGFLFVATNPSLATATMCYRLFAGTRIIHTFVYAFAVPQPARGLSFGAGMLVNLYMAFRIIFAFA